jgi:hypothetical protein
VVATLPGDDICQNNGNGYDAPSGTDDWPNSVYNVDPRVVVWLKTDDDMHTDTHNESRTTAAKMAAAARAVAASTSPQYPQKFGRLGLIV